MNIELLDNDVRTIMNDVMDKTVFEKHDDELRQQVINIVNQHMISMMTEQFRVICDNTNNQYNDELNIRLETCHNGVWKTYSTKIS